jgi:DNA-binding CsgD family transcriptional regulator
VVAGSVYLSRRVAAVTVRQLAGSREAGRRAGPSGLTDRELEIFHLIAAARPNREIAQALGMSVKTVETHKENIKIKLGATSAAELAERARVWLVGHDRAAPQSLS